MGGREGRGRVALEIRRGWRCGPSPKATYLAGAVSKPTQMLLYPTRSRRAFAVTIFGLKIAVTTLDAGAVGRGVGKRESLSETRAKGIEWILTHAPAQRQSEHHGLVRSPQVIFRIDNDEP